MKSLGEDLLWRAINRPAFRTRRPALFLDRDGVIVEERHYLRDPALVSIIPGIVELIAAARAVDLAVICVTNQAGIGRGLITWEEFAAVEARIASLLVDEGVCLDAVLACPFHPEGIPPYDRPHPWRKPEPGMLLEAAARLNVALGRSLLIGDKASDLMAAKAAGLPAAVHVATGHGKRERSNALALSSATFSIHAVIDLSDLSHLIKRSSG